MIGFQQLPTPFCFVIHYQNQLIDITRKLRGSAAILKANASELYQKQNGYLDSDFHSYFSVA